LLFQNQSSWSLFWLNVTIYALTTAWRMQVDVWIPAKYFDPNRWWFRGREWERRGDFYRDVLRIDRWKGRLPSVNARNHFSKRYLAGTDPSYLRQFVIETCRGESNHLRAVLSVVPMRLWTPLELWTVCFLIALIGNLPFILIQRYNRPRLQRALARVERRALTSARPRGLPSARPHALSDTDDTDLQPARVWDIGLKSST
jgi:glycosyl-4,4'-diaponeurosporenoate acyltransferase